MSTQWAETFSPVGIGPFSSHLTVTSSACRLLKSALQVLMAPQCSEPSRQAVLTLVESLLASEGGLGECVLAPHSGLLLEALRHIILGAWTAKVRVSSAACIKSTVCCQGQWVSQALCKQLVPGTPLAPSTTVNL